MALRFLPASKSVRREYRKCAYGMNVTIYVFIIILLVRNVFFNFSHVTVRVEEREIPDDQPWGHMPWITLCVDHDTGVQILIAKAIIAQGFGYWGSENKLSASCTIDEEPKWHFINGTPTKDGECMKLNLTRLKPFIVNRSITKSSPNNIQRHMINNVAFGAVLWGNRHLPNFSQPKFVAVEASAEEPLWLDSDIFTRQSMFKPQLFVPIQSWSYKEQRFESPVFSMEKRVSSKKRKDWKQVLVEIGFSIFAAESTLFTMSNMGYWDNCLPKNVLPDSVISLALGLGCNVSSFGLFINKSTVTSIYDESIWQKFLKCFASLGGMLYFAYLVFFVIWTPPKSSITKADDELLDLQPVLKGCLNRTPKCCKCLAELCYSCWWLCCCCCCCCCCRKRNRFRFDSDSLSSNEPLLDKANRQEMEEVNQRVQHLEDRMQDLVIELESYSRLGSISRGASDEEMKKS
mmetsp:Transcript_167728/g.322072  ORF Transcript_167728/g.322072 Transcript_167728/m.322072 type:complete len:461 (-) Transcript_167728:39-1421(-)